MRRLTYDVRQPIMCWCQGGLRIRNVAQMIDRDHSVVSRAIQRNKGQKVSCFISHEHIYGTLGQPLRLEHAGITYLRKLFIELPAQVSA